MEIPYELVEVLPTEPPGPKKPPKPPRPHDIPPIEDEPDPVREPGQDIPPLDLYRKPPVPERSRNIGLGADISNGTGPPRRSLR